MNVDEVKVGGYQILTLMLLGVNLVIVGMSHALSIFYKHRPEFHCEGDVSNATSACSPSTSSCSKVFDEANRTSVAIDWQLLCDDKQYLLNASGNVYFGGMLLGGIVAGLIMDRIGRMPVMAICLYAQGTMTVALNMVNRYSLFLTFRALQGFFVQGLESSTYVLCIELFPSRYRALVSLIVLSMRAVGLSALAGLDFVVLDWRVLQLVVAVPTAITVLYIWLIPESARWLLSRARLTDAEMVLERIANYNGLFSRESTSAAPEKPKRKAAASGTDECARADVEKSAAEEVENLLEEKLEDGKADLDADEIAKASSEMTSLEQADQSYVSKETLATEDVGEKIEETRRKSRIAEFFEEMFIGRTCLVLMCLWFASSTAFHALISLPHRVKLERHASLATAGAVELVTFALGYLLISSRCGRRATLLVGQIVAGAVCVAVVVVGLTVSEKDNKWIGQYKIAIVKVGAVANIVCFFVLRILTIELFPTISRGTGLGLCVAAEMLAGLGSAWILKLNDYVANKKMDVSRISMGLFCICVAFLTVILSETVRLRSLPDSVEDAKMLNEKNGGEDNEQPENPEKLRKKLFTDDWVEAGNGIIVNFTENKSVD